MGIDIQHHKYSIEWKHPVHEPFPYRGKAGVGITFPLPPLSHTEKSPTPRNSGSLEGNYLVSRFVFRAPFSFIVRHIETKLQSCSFLV